MNKKYVSTHDKKYVENKLTTYTFIPDTNYFVMHGIAKKTINESGSGDNFSCINLDNGQTLLSISDGMGTGDKANWESSQVVELIEEFSQCGYSEELTLTLINNLFISKADMSPATVDMSIIDKHSGMCDIVKSGAATTYVKRDGWVEAIKSTSLPIGVMGNVDVETAKKKLYDGDFVIMVSDGILESVCEEEKDKVISNIILEAKSKKPKELAFEILNKVCEVPALAPVPPQDLQSSLMDTSISFSQPKTASSKSIVTPTLMFAPLIGALLFLLRPPPKNPSNISPKISPISLKLKSKPPPDAPPAPPSNAAWPN